MSRMECGESADLLLRFAAGRLDPEAGARIERHLLACASCREFAAGQRAVWDALDAWETAPVSPDFDRRLYRRIESEGAWWARLMAPFRPAPIRRGLPVAAAACFALVAGIMVVDRSPGVRPPPRKASVQVESLRPDQVESALEEMEMLREINGLVRPDSAPSAM
jgi:anti-sigma factor RsiW